MIRFRAILLAAFICASAPAMICPADSGYDEKSPAAATPSNPKPQIEHGFNLLYSLKFDEARKQFATWQQTNPDDPLGYIASAAGYLFEEFHSQGVLTSSFFLDDKRFLGGIQGKPDEGRKTQFEAANRKGKEFALKQLHNNPEDVDALFAITVATGLEADFAAVIEKHQMESLTLTRSAEGYAKQLLALKPDEADAWFSLGAANYIIGCLPTYKRFFLWFGGIRGDKILGMEQMKIAAEKGHYLKSFAKIFLALAAMREKQIELARRLLSELASQFPENPLYRTELSFLESHYTGVKNGEQ
jgi:hypothetical protein